MNINKGKSGFWLFAQIVCLSLSRIGKISFPLSKYTLEIYALFIDYVSETYEDGVSNILLYQKYEKAERIKSKYKERVKQKDLSRIPPPKKIPSSTSDNTDYSWAEQELKFLLESKKTKHKACQNVKVKKKKR